MNSRRRLYVAGFVGASISYIFNVLAFTGQFDVFRWTVFAVIFLAVFFGFEKFIEWSERFDD
ncbi:hypothetical protein [Halorubrum trueperi]|uniref:Uncharacterized protein n=1 Tax=Halorubrum trueperi TaxID=2004704 RepID=A0ABD5UNE0_9EURY